MSRSAPEFELIYDDSLAITFGRIIFRHDAGMSAIEYRVPFFGF